MTMDRNAEIIIAGAGLAGLQCARTLAAAGFTRLTVLEAADAPGGRVRTDLVDGFRIDRGFQVLLTDYPEARTAFDYPRLSLRPFRPGAMVRHDGRWIRMANPLRDPAGALGSLTSSPPRLPDKLRAALLTLRWTAGTADELASLPPESSAAFLSRTFSPEMVDCFFRPFFSGVFLERDLRSSVRWLAWLYRLFATGETAVPALGMEELPRQLAAGLPPGTIRCRTAVSSLTDDGVLLTDGTRLHARAVVVAVDPPAAHRLLDRPPPAMRATASFAFAADGPPLPDACVFLNGTGTGPLGNATIMSNVSRDLAPPGRALIVASSLPGCDGWDDPATIHRQLREWFGPAVDDWKLLTARTIAAALPDDAALDPHFGGRPARLDRSRYLCGDHTATPSINGALLSGRRAAEELLADLSADR